MPASSGQTDKGASSSPLNGWPDSLRSSLRMVTIAWLFGAAWMYITTGATQTRYAKLLHMPEFGFGLMAAVPYLTALAQLPASFFIERYGYRKLLFLWAGVIHRALWLVVAAIPWLVPQESAWGALLGVLGLSALAAQVATPAVLAWFADIIPRRIRGRYLSRRAQVGQVAGVVVTLLTGYSLDLSGALGDRALLRTISFAFAVAAVSGVLDFVCLVPVPDPRPHHPHPGLRLWTLLRQPLANREFRLYLGFNATLIFAIGFIGQFVWLYVFDVVGFSNTHANLLLVVIPLLVAMLSYPFWGRVMDRVGRRPVLLVAGFLIVHGAVGWIFVTKTNWWVGYITVLLATWAWPGVELANLNFLLGMSESKQGRGLGSAYVAITSVVVAIAGTLSGLFGGAVAHALEGWRGTLLGWPLTYHGVLFLVSAALRLASLGWVVAMREPRAQATWSVVRLVASSTYSNLQQAVLMPARGWWRLRQLVYRSGRVVPAPRRAAARASAKPTGTAAPRYP